MPPRPMLPPDDLYARLELPVDASFEAVEVAWRALLKRHHPDVAGPDANAVAKRINVAHDWLSDRDLRARYDRERHPQPARSGSIRGGRPVRGGGRGHDGDGRHDKPVARRPSPPRPVDPEQALARHLERIARLTLDELDRLTLAETQPIAFVASIARFLPKERLAALDSVERRVRDVLPARARWDAATRDAAVGFAYELLLGPFLDEHLSAPFRERVRERLARGWEAAVDQPRFGPNTAAVRAAIGRIGGVALSELRDIADEAARPGVRTDLPWPRGLSAIDDDGLRVSSALAQRDAIAALPVDASGQARLTLARAIHGLVLRHGFSAAELNTIAGPWRSVVLPPAAAGPATRRRTG
ncbi:MAG TPA: J domain-containing protein [Patescibacteria group bacterium]|nr:J domain-containing protein [Patescibacteria group bacterium]